MDRTLFVSHKHVPDSVGIGRQLVVYMEHRTAGVPEDRINPLTDEGLAENPCAPHWLRLTLIVTNDTQYLAGCL
jgi:hypothetical protein